MLIGLSMLYFKAYLTKAFKKTLNYHSMKLKKDHSCGCSNQVNNTYNRSIFSHYKVFSLILGLFFLIISSYIEFKTKAHPFIYFLFYFAAFAPSGVPIIYKSIKEILKKNIFTEFFLISIASIAAFFIKEYAEAVALMLLYNIGELFQDNALDKSKASIKALLDIRPKKAYLLQGKHIEETDPGLIKKGQIIQVKTGQRVPLDGILLSNDSFFDTSAINGESKPYKIYKEQEVLSGMIPLENPIEIKVNKLFNDSSFSRILDLIENATDKKAKIENAIRKTAKIYTPILLCASLMVLILPYFILKENYDFNLWLYRALILLIIACPCALVISIPLTYFAAIGVASKKGILFKGSYFVDLLRKIKIIAFDKTGTLTKGLFEIEKVIIEDKKTSLEEFIKYACALENTSTHPIAKAICNYAVRKKISYNHLKIENIKEYPAYGIIGEVDHKRVVIGNLKLFKQQHLTYPKELSSLKETMALVAVEEKFIGYFTLADPLKEEASQTIKALKELKMGHICILSGDKISVVKKIAHTLKIEKFYGELLPEEKLDYLKKIKKNHPNDLIAFIGDGINDAPSMAFSDLSIAMGKIGSDLAIETSDIVIQTDNLFWCVKAIKIAQKTYEIILQNISIAFLIKIMAIFLGVMGWANLWQALLADVGACLITIGNAIRIQKIKI